MFLIHFYNFIACNCDRVGSQEAACDGYGNCICKNGYAAQKCDICAIGLYKKWNGSQDICSGISAFVV